MKLYKGSKEEEERMARVYEYWRAITGLNKRATREDILDAIEDLMNENYFQSYNRFRQNTTQSYSTIFIK